MSRPEFLLLHFDPAADFNAAHWIHCAADGEPQSAERSDPLEHIAAEAGGRTVIGLLPGTSVLAQRVSLPRANRKKRLQAVPYALEERLAADPETLHFALAASADEPITVEVVARDLVQRVLDRCRAAGLTLDALHADAACIAPKPGDLQVWWDGDEWHVRHPDGRRQTLPAADLDSALRLTGIDADGASVNGLRLHGLARTAPPGFERLNVAGGAKYLPLEDGALAWLARQRLLAAPIDLLQGEFAAARGIAAIDWSRWRRVAIAAAIFVAISLVVAADDFHRSRAAAQAVDRALLDASRGILPQGTAAADAASLLRSRVRIMTTNAGAPSVPEALSALAEHGARNALRIRSLHASTATIECTLTLRDAAALEALRQSLALRGWKSTVSGTRNTAAALEARLSLTHTGHGS